MERGEKVYAGNEFFLSRESRYFYANPGSVECPGRYTTDLIRVAGTKLTFRVAALRGHKCRACRALQADKVTITLNA